MKIKLKFGLFSISIIVLSVALISGFIIFKEKRTLTKNMEQHRSHVFESLRTLSKEAFLLHDEILFLNYANSIKKTNKEISYVFFSYLEDVDRVLYSTKRKVPLTELIRGMPYIKSKHDREISTKYKSDLFGNIFEISSLLSVRGSPLGVLRLGFSQDILSRKLYIAFKAMLYKILIGALIAISIGIIFSLIFSSSLLKPIYNLSDGAKELGRGNLEKRIDIISKDELGELSEAFNIMAEKLQELDKLKDDFVNSVSHELRSPLSAIEGYIDLLQYGMTNPFPKAKQEKALRIMKNSTNRLSDFITNILDVAKIKAGKMYGNMTVFDVRGVAKEIEELFEPKAKEQGIELKAEFDDDLQNIYADVDKIKQVFTNLISNALKFTKEGGQINTFCRKYTENFIKCGVSDTGEGMGKEETEKVFGKFYQVKREEQVKGTGLGLAIVKGIVEMHKGKIWVESEKDKGTTFFFTLPISQ